MGVELASRLGYSHLDLDELVEKVDGRSIANIFQQDGEDYFRRLEARVTRTVESERSVVLSTGGGWAANPYLPGGKRPGDLVVWLQVSTNEVLARLADESEVQLRPLLKGSDPRTRVTELLGQREPAYRTADLTISTDGKSVDEVATEILDNGIQQT